MAQRSDSPDQSTSRTNLQRLLSSSFIREAATPDGVGGSKADRMVRLQTTDLFIKGIRPNFDKRDLDFLCDLVCANLGQHLGVPVIPQVPIDHPDHGLGLVSPYLDGETGIAVDDPGQLANAEAVAQLCVFEEWVMNTDDKSEHFRTVERNGEKRAYAFDHGHTLHQANDFSDEEVADTPRIRQSVGKDPNPYGYGAVAEVESGIDLIKGVSDEEVSRIVRHSLDQLRRTGTDDQDIETLVDDADSHTTIVTNILRERRKHIDQIMESKLE